MEAPIPVVEGSIHTQLTKLPGLTTLGFHLRHNNRHVFAHQNVSSSFVLRIHLLNLFVFELILIANAEVNQNAEKQS